MNELLNPPWYTRFRAEMEALGCKFPETYPNMFGNEDIQIPSDKQAEAFEVVKRYTTAVLKGLM